MIRDEELHHWIRTIGSIVGVLAIVGMVNMMSKCASEEAAQAHQPSNSMWVKAAGIKPSADPDAVTLSHVYSEVQGQFVTLAPGHLLKLARTSSNSVGCFEPYAFDRSTLKLRRQFADGGQDPDFIEWDKFRHMDTDRIISAIEVMNPAAYDQEFRIDACVPAGTPTAVVLSPAPGSNTTLAPAASKRELADVIVPAGGSAVLEWHREESVWWEVPQGVKIIREWEDASTHRAVSRDPEELDRQYALPVVRDGWVLGRVTFSAKNFSYPVHVVLSASIAAGDNTWSLRAQ